MLTMSQQKRLDITTRKAINVDDNFIECFLEKLGDNDGLITQLIEFADFEANRHDIHDGCPYDDKECEDCYSWDTENDNENRRDKLLARIWKDAYEEWKFHGHGLGIGEDDEEEGSDEAIEIEDSDDNREEQNEDGVYVKVSHQPPIEQAE